MSSVEGFENFTSRIYSKIVREQDEATMQMIENYVKENPRCSKYKLLSYVWKKVR